MNQPVKQQKLNLLAITLVLLLSYPLISIFDKNKLIGGIPVLFLYIFMVWVSVIVLVYIITEIKRRRK